MGVAGVSTGDVVLLSSQTASSDSTIEFTSGITSTYGEYIFKFYNLHPSGSGDFGFQVNASSQSGYNETITSTFFRAIHNEGNTAASLGYVTGSDQAQGTSFQELARTMSTDNDAGLAGELHLFNPSSTTYVKHFYATTQGALESDYSQNAFAAGYINVTAAITDVQFKFHTGNIDEGTIKMWGVKN